MKKYYSVTLINRERNTKTSYVADSFSVNEDRILAIKSEKYGGVVVQIKNDEELVVNETELEDKFRIYY